MLKPLTKFAPTLALSALIKMLFALSAPTCVPLNDCNVASAVARLLIGGMMPKPLTTIGGVVSDQVSADVPSVIGFAVVSRNRPLELTAPPATATMSPWANCELLFASIARVHVEVWAL